MSKLEENRKAKLEEAQKLLKNMTQEDANKYISENLMITQITKGFMAAYIKQFATSSDEKKWVKEEFKKASTKIATKKVTTVCMGANGLPIHKLNKDGKVIAKTVRVDSATGETYETFDLSGARKAFIDHFKITPKTNKFTPKAKRTEPVFDEFADLF